MPQYASSIASCAQHVGAGAGRYALLTADQDEIADDDDIHGKPKTKLLSQ
jgi:hypothetical protein